MKQINQSIRQLVAVKRVGVYLRVELVVAQVERGVDGLEGLEVDVDLLFGGDKFFFLSMASFIIQSILVLVLCCDLDYYRKR